jgi:hypothetical protein
MISGVWLLCRWLLSEVVRRSMAHSPIHLTTSGDLTPLYSQLQLLYFSLYSHAIDYRKNIIQFLFKSCHSQLPYLHDRARHASSSSSSSSPSPLTPVAILLSNSQSHSTLSLLSTTDPLTSQHQQAKISCFLLESILRGHPAEANEIYSSLSHRIHSSFSSSYERYAIDEKRGYCQLPQPFVLHRSLLPPLLLISSSLDSCAA